MHTHTLASSPTAIASIKICKKAFFPSATFEAKTLIFPQKRRQKKGSIYSSFSKFTYRFFWEGQRRAKDLFCPIHILENRKSKFANTDLSQEAIGDCPFSKRRASLLQTVFFPFFLSFCSGNYERAISFFRHRWRLLLPLSLPSLLMETKKKYPTLPPKAKRKKYEGAFEREARRQEIEDKKKSKKNKQTKIPLYSSNSLPPCPPKISRFSHCERKHQHTHLFFPRIFSLSLSLYIYRLKYMDDRNAKKKTIQCADLFSLFLFFSGLDRLTPVSRKKKLR